MDGQVDDADEVRAQAAEWFARLKTVPVSRDTLEQFFEWRRVEAHGAAFEAVERVWSIAGEAAERPGIVAALEAAATRHRQGRGRRGWRGPFAIAAVLVTGGAGLSLLLSHPGRHYETQVGEQRRILLDDGSKLTLDTDTAVTVRYSATQRRITLDHGQAFFEVAHAADRPFVVDAARAQVRATGTQFEVRRLGPATEVTLVEGSVQVSSPQSRAIARLSSGQQYRVTDAQPPAVRIVDTAADTAWRRGRIVFDGTSLTSAIEEVNRYVRRPIRLAPGVRGDAPVSGSFETGDVDGFVAAATAILPLRAERGADGAIMLTAGDGPDRK